MTIHDSLSSQSGGNANLARSCLLQTEGVVLPHYNPRSIGWQMQASTLKLAIQEQPVIVKLGLREE